MGAAAQESSGTGRAHMGVVHRAACEDQNGSVARHRLCAAW